MAASFVRHRVRDYDTWRRVYDAFADAQKAGGVINQAVYRAEGDPNTVLIFHQFSTTDHARAFFSSPELQQAMREAGVEEGTLRMEFFEEA
jgi:quinol monooxygenase YgiN